MGKGPNYLAVRRKIAAECMQSVPYFLKGTSTKVAPKYNFLDILTALFLRPPPQIHTMHFKIIGIHCLNLIAHIRRRRTCVRYVQPAAADLRTISFPRLTARTYTPEPSTHICVKLPIWYTYIFIYINCVFYLRHEEISGVLLLQYMKGAKHECASMISITAEIPKWEVCHHRRRRTAHIYSKLANFINVVYIKQIKKMINEHRSMWKINPVQL